MSFVSFRFCVFLCLLTLVYYALPMKRRYLALLAGSIYFYLSISADAWWIFGAATLASFALGRLLARFPSRFLLAVSVVIILTPLLLIKNGNFVLVRLLHEKPFPWIVPLGISYYTLQMISYLVDTYSGKIKEQPDFLRYLLYISFFPHIVQGPIPRYENLMGGVD